jgi:hypothetical protein
LTNGEVAEKFLSNFFALTIERQSDILSDLLRDYYSDVKRYCGDYYARKELERFLGMSESK